MRKFSKDPDAISRLSPEQYRVTQQSGTEAPGTGCGWPSFTKVFASLMVMFAITAGLASAAEQRVQEVNYSSVEVHGIKVFYREAGPADGPPILLLHGFPASSHMFRDLMPKLADRYRVIAPDYPGYGRSDAPSAVQFNYTFERLTDVVESLTEKLGVARYSLYMQHFGGPVGFRLATRHPERVQALVVQNAIAHAEGLSDSFAPARAYWANRSAETEKPMTDSIGSKDDGNDRRTFSLQRRLPTEGLQTSFSFRGNPAVYYHGAEKF